jgi:hypothetical protein
MFLLSFLPFLLQVATTCLLHQAMDGYLPTCNMLAVRLLLSAISYEVAQNVDSPICPYLLGNNRIKHRDHMLQKESHFSGLF